MIPGAVLEVVPDTSSQSQPYENESLSHLHWGEPRAGSEWSPKSLRALTFN
jgi:hypothetical protein